MQETYYYKQVNIADQINIKRTGRGCLVVENPTAEVFILSSKVSDTIEGMSLNGECFTGKQMILAGYVKAKLYILNSGCKGQYQCLVHTIPFSTYIVVPKELCGQVENRVGYTVEDVTVNQMNNYQIILSITILFEYLDEYLENGICR